jgi:hypothetical protein
MKQETLSRIGVTALGAVKEGSVWRCRTGKFEIPDGCGNTQTIQTLLNRGLIEDSDVATVDRQMTQMKTTSKGNLVFHFWPRPTP